MTATVPTLSIVFIVLDLILAFAMPVLLAVWLHMKKGAQPVPFWVGCIVFLLFALMLESLMHQAVLGGAAGEAIMGNVWLYALYGGLAAGIFEETGRFLAFKTVLKKHRANDANALMYGAGHGGFECMALLGLTMVNNLVYALMINSGGVEAINGLLAGGSGVDEATATLAAEQIGEAVTALTTTSPWVFLLSPVERAFAIAIHVGLSVLVWFAAKTPGRWWLYPVAILAHAFVDGSMVLVQDALSGVAGGTVFVEAYVGVTAAAVCLIAWRVWKANASLVAAA